MTKFMMVVLAIAMGLAACAKSESKEYKESYDFTENNCPTDRHEFKSTSPDETKRQLCEALQDRSVNNGCAESLRYAFFMQKCSGYEWRPK